jgi:two-component system sensor histidine kinase/response regulator
MTGEWSSAALDPGVLDTLRELSEPGRPDVLREVLGLFLTDGPMRLTAIEAAVTARDGAALQRSAHTLKGGAATIGALALQASCRVLEELGKQNRFDTAPEALAIMRREYARVKAAIDQLL